MMRKQRRNHHKFLSTPVINISLIFIVLLVSACGRQQSQNSEADVMKGSIIVGSLDWKEITSLSSSHPIRQQSVAVGAVDLPVMGSRCTGFMISEDVLMTNQHCIPSSRHANGVTVVFNHLDTVSKNDFVKYDCSTFIGNDSKLDFALLKCQGKPGRKYGFVELSDDPVQKNASIYVVQQNCDYYSSPKCDWTKKYSKGTVTKIDDEYTHNADTLGGSSGSPVFSTTTNTVVAIHHAGYGNNGMGRGYENYAVPMHKIVQKIYDQFPQVDLGSGDNGGGNNGGGGSGQTSDFEPNNSLSSAATISLPFKKSLKISTSTDNDYFKFVAPKAGKIKVSLKFKHSHGDLDVKLINGSKKVVNKSQSSSDNESMTYEVSKKGTYYVKVYGYKGAQASYSVDISFEAKVTDDEPNDSFETASKVDLPYQAVKNIKDSKDYDFYTFTVSKSKKVSAKISFSHSKGDLDLYLLNADKQVVDKSASVKSTESLSRTLGPGKYYVVVLGYKGATGSYSLELK